DDLLVIINDILDVSKIEAGKLDLDNSPFSLEELLITTSNITAHQAKEKGLKLIFDTPSQLSEQFMGDHVRIGQVLINLINNAIKFTERGEVVVSIELQAIEDCVNAKFSVKDTGVGISSEHQSRLFNAFEQADNSSTRKHGGTGLGLTISSELVAMMGGELQVKSAPGEGSCFSFILELPTIHIEPEQVQAESHNDSATMEDRLETIRGARILVVEDLDLNQMLIKDLLGLIGLEVEIADNGADALKLLEPDRFDLVLMDLQMPVMDGYEATQNIRAKKIYDKLPVIGLTGHAMVEVREKCLAAGMNDKLTKPINLEALHEMLLRWIKPSG
ncbi:MAG: ATP-binding protein, partial [Chromatiales bacterium]|nr:ATP-binding protein [Chromatiales bacterium]